MKIFNRWPIKVFLIQERAKGGRKIKQMRAQRRSEKDGTVRYILKNGKTIPPVLYKYITNDNYLFLFQDKTENFAVMDMKKPESSGLEDEDIVDTNDIENPIHPVSFEEAKITGIDTNVKNWAINSLKKDREKWMQDTFWEKYGHFIAPAVLLIAASIMIYISLEKIIALDQISTNAVNKLAEILKQKVATGGW